VVTFRGQDRQVIQRDFLLAAAVPVPVGNQVVRYTIQPRREWNAAIFIVVNVVHCPLEDAGCEILCIVQVACPVVDVVEDTVNVSLIELTERITVTI